MICSCFAEAVALSILEYETLQCVLLLNSGVVDVNFGLLQGVLFDWYHPKVTTYRQSNLKSVYNLQST